MAPGQWMSDASALGCQADAQGRIGKLVQGAEEVCQRLHSPERSGCRCVCSLFLWFGMGEQNSPQDRPGEQLQVRLLAQALVSKGFGFGCQAQQGKKHSGFLNGEVPLAAKGNDGNDEKAQRGCQGDT